jgi:hypothetical protein
MQAYPASLDLPVGRSRLDPHASLAFFLHSSPDARLEGTSEVMAFSIRLLASLISYYDTGLPLPVGLIAPLDCSVNAVPAGLGRLSGRLSSRRASGVILGSC